MTLLCLTAHVDRAWPVESHLQKKKKFPLLLIYYQPWDRINIRLSWTLLHQENYSNTF